MVVSPGVDLPEQSVSSALLPVIMISNQRRSNNISLLLMWGRTRPSVSPGRRRRQTPTRRRLTRKKSDWGRYKQSLGIGINFKLCKYFKVINVEYHEYNRDYVIIIIILRFLRLSTIKKCPHMHRLDHRELRNSKVKLRWWWVVVVGGGGWWWYERIFVTVRLRLNCNLLIVVF